MCEERGSLGICQDGWMDPFCLALALPVSCDCGRQKIGASICIAAGTLRGCMFAWRDRKFIRHGLLYDSEAIRRIAFGCCYVVWSEHKY
jgi:hypothetical protein